MKEYTGNRSVPTTIQNKKKSITEEINKSLHTQDSKNNQNNYEICLSDVSVSTISNSSGIDSDLYEEVIKKIKKEKKRKRKESKRDIYKEKVKYDKKESNSNDENKNDRGNEKDRKNNSDIENNSDSEYINDKEKDRKKRKHIDIDKKKRNKESHHHVNKKKDKNISTRKKRKYTSSLSSESYERRKDKKKKKEKYRNSESSYKSMVDENIPKDPFNPLLLAYEKKEKKKYRKKKYFILCIKKIYICIIFNRYENTSDDEDINIEKAYENSKPYFDPHEFPKILWKSKAGGVCVPQISDDKK
ncbi:hypothetical protein PFAG_05961 [Plasmodium falciparum Santa Lucia]|uniref:Uncharacterized protein n=2 Tax=Plasmodium falciparum TaxID=5833 RepID=W7JIG0_PLAFA|nr:hypothetical protein PFAG_05961 [Plasmodium falciparum Santa Lucia]EWC74608.1 hypothetical protein C923_04719 [Plasmodium falciparum UGT5.1]